MGLLLEVQICLNTKYMHERKFILQHETFIFKFVFLFVLYPSLSILFQKIFLMNEVTVPFSTQQDVQTPQTFTELVSLK
jgi:hypothetical protein